MSNVAQILYSHKIFRYILIAITLGLLVLIFYMLFPYVPEGKDWANYFRPAIVLIFSGKSPFEIPFNYAPWAMLPLAPLALLPPRVGSTILVITCPVVFSIIAYKLGAKPLSVLFFVFSSPVIHSALNINIDWLPALGILMPPQIGLFFLLIKPQNSIGIVIFWFFEAWQKERIKGIIKLFLPVTFMYLLSFAIYGFWPLTAAKMTMDYAKHPFSNASIFPWGIPIGLAILFFSIRKKLRNLSISASPFLSPFVTMQNWSSVLLGLVNYQAILISASIISWIITIWGWSLKP